LERMIEAVSLRCRIYTRGRVASAGASFFGGITGVVGVASVVSLAAHNLFTYNPDYELGKNYIDHTISVTYK